MKLARVTICLPDDLMSAIKTHCATEYLKTSNYFEKLSRKDLAAKLPADEVAAEVTRLRELIEVKGLPAVRAKLNEIAGEMAAVEGDSR